MEVVKFEMGIHPWNPHEIETMKIQEDFEGHVVGEISVGKLLEKTKTKNEKKDKK